MGEPRPPGHPKPPAALIATLSNAVEALGRGFDVTADSRLLYCKGAPGSRLVRLDKALFWDFEVSEAGAVLAGVPGDVDIARGRPGRETTPVCSFREVRPTSVLAFSIYAFGRKQEHFNFDSCLLSSFH